jgi:hypothetical protein
LAASPHAPTRTLPSRGARLSGSPSPTEAQQNPNELARFPPNSAMAVYSAGACPYKENPSLRPLRHPLDPCCTSRRRGLRRQPELPREEIIVIMEEERRGFDEMGALALASLFWRRTRQTNSKMDTRQHLGLRKPVSMSCHRLPFPCTDAVCVLFSSPSLLLHLGIGVPSPSPSLSCHLLFPMSKSEMNCTGAPPRPPARNI